jgi:hypothetical protein
LGKLSGKSVFLLKKCSSKFLGMSCILKIKIREFLRCQVEDTNSTGIKLCLAGDHRINIAADFPVNQLAPFYEYFSNERTVGSDKITGIVDIPVGIDIEKIASDCITECINSGIF